MNLITIVAFNPALYRRVSLVIFLLRGTSNPQFTLYIKFSRPAF